MAKKGTGLKQRIYYFLLAGMFLSAAVYAEEYHVAKNGNDANAGSAEKPFFTITRAIEQAFPGDTVTVHSGTYRERIDPIRGGESDSNRILYRAAPGEKVEIKGSERINGWEEVKDGVWKVTVPNELFGSYNPYRDSIHGDWFIDKGRIHHTGELFLNGKSLYEKESIEKVYDPLPAANVRDSDASVYTWYCESDAENTRIWANFHSFDPNKELTEISSRETCIYPERPGIDYITIRGFHISQAATQWPAPTAEQVGMVATHWNKGWIIENNVISDSKCAGITLGKDRSTGHNVWSADEGNINRDGNIHYIEVIFRVLRNGWDKENVGSHIVRNNRIFNCGQAGICGSMGAAFSIIENNHIHDIWQKRQFEGWEIAGIKFHAPVDVEIRKNRIHDAGRGLWLDWMTQGARVTGNLLYDNHLGDLFMEVNHGPFIVDNNILLSPTAVVNQSQGGAYIHNLIGGKILVRNDPRRFTPYFLPHSTDIAGFATIYGGDDRWYNNIFTGRGNPEDGEKYGLEAYGSTRLPVQIEGNVYYHGALPSVKDTAVLSVPEHDPGLELREEDGAVYLHIAPERKFTRHRVEMITGGLLGKAKIPKAVFENPAGTPYAAYRDYSGNARSGRKNRAGPFSGLKKGKTPVKVW
ncbi:MAG: right-handed parallel beta-helix repeat-containing protein [Fidelibacterota bacterium]